MARALTLFRRTIAALKHAKEAGEDGVTVVEREIGMAQLDGMLERLTFVAECAARGDLDGVEIEDGKLFVARTPPAVPEAARDLAQLAQLGGGFANFAFSLSSQINRLAFVSGRIGHVVATKAIPFCRRVGF